MAACLLVALLAIALSTPDPAIPDPGRVVLLEKAVRVWLPSASRQTLAGAAVQADLLEGPHQALKAAAIATAPFLLPRGTAQVHQFWAFNPALAAPIQLPMRALEALAAQASPCINTISSCNSNGPDSRCRHLNHFWYTRSNALWCRTPVPCTHRYTPS